MARKTAREINIEAAAWAVRLDEGLSSKEEGARLDAWLALDERHPGALARMRAFNSFTWKVKALGPGFVPEATSGAAADLSDSASAGVEIPERAQPDDSDADRADVAAKPQTAAPSRRTFLRAGGAIAATTVVGALVGWERLHTNTYRTGIGDSKVVALKDGSVITLNTESQIAINFSDQERAIRMIRGEVTFDVAKDPAHPFVVAVGETRVKVVGTSFTVQRLRTLPVQVLVRQGIVEVSHLGDAGTPVLVHANTRATTPIDRGPVAAVPIAPGELKRELAWQDGRIAFEGQTLAQAAAEFSRYSDIKIVVTDHALAGEEIVGLFRANDPIGFAKTIAVSLNARATIGEGQIRLSR
jgi:transmembrane sensor